MQFPTCLEAFTQRKLGAILWWHCGLDFHLCFSWGCILSSLAPKCWGNFTTHCQGCHGHFMQGWNLQLYSRRRDKKYNNPQKGPTLDLWYPLATRVPLRKRITSNRRCRLLLKIIQNKKKDNSFPSLADILNPLFFNIQEQFDNQPPCQNKQCGPL